MIERKEIEPQEEKIAPVGREITPSIERFPKEAKEEGLVPPPSEKEEAVRPSLSEIEERAEEQVVETGREEISPPESEIFRATSKFSLGRDEEQQETAAALEEILSSRG